MDLYVPPKPAIILPSTRRKVDHRGVFGAPIGMFGKEPTVVTWLGSGTLTSNSSSFSASFSLGTARPDRVIVVFFQSYNSGLNSTHANCTGYFGVSPAAYDISGGGVAPPKMLYAAVPTGTSGTVSFQHPSVNMITAVMSVYSVTGIVSTTAVAVLTSGGTLTTTPSGAALCATFAEYSDVNPSGSWSNKKRVVAGGTGAGWSMNSFDMNPTPSTSTGAAGSSGRTCSISFY